MSYRTMVVALLSGCLIGPPIAAQPEQRRGPASDREGGVQAAERAGAMGIRGGQAALRAAIRQRIPAEDVKWLRAATRRQLAGCRVRAHNGIWLHTPDGVGNYRALWTRDFQYMVQYAGDLLDPVEIRASIEYLLAGQREDGCMPDRVTVEGKGVYSPGAEQHPLADHALDNGPFMARLVCSYVQLTGDLEFFRRVEPALGRGLLFVRRDSTGLVFNPPEAPQCPYGFTDTVAKSGHLLFCSLLDYDASVRMAHWCRRARCGDPETYGARAKRTRHALPLLWDSATGMFWAADHDCRQIDIWGSALAVQLGCTSAEQTRRVAEYLVRHYDRVVQRGQVRHLADGEQWQRMFVPIKAGTYQNGAFWGTPIAWVAPVIAVKDPQLAGRMVRDAIDDYRRRGIRECVNGTYHNVPEYVVSATNVYGLLRD